MLALVYSTIYWQYCVLVVLLCNRKNTCRCEFEFATVLQLHGKSSPQPLLLNAMEAVAAAVGQAPVMRDFRRNVASTVVILTLGTLLIAGKLQQPWNGWVHRLVRQMQPHVLHYSNAGGADWSYRGISNWAHNKGMLGPCADCLASLATSNAQQIMQ